LPSFKPAFSPTSFLFCYVSRVVPHSCFRSEYHWTFCHSQEVALDPHSISYPRLLCLRFLFGVPYAATLSTRARRADHILGFSPYACFKIPILLPLFFVSPSFYYSAPPFFPFTVLFRFAPLLCSPPLFLYGLLNNIRTNMAPHFLKRSLSPSEPTFSLVLLDQFEHPPGGAPSGAPS